VHLDELSIYGLQRLAAVLMATSAAAGASAAVSPGEAAELEACALGDIVVISDCPVPLLLRQVGSPTVAEKLAPHSSRCLPQRYLCAPSPTPPALIHEGLS